MLFASSIGEDFFWVMMFIGCGIWATRRVLGKWDSDGKVKEAAKGGIIRMIGRWLK